MVPTDYVFCALTQSLGEKEDLFDEVWLHLRYKLVDSMEKGFVLGGKCVMGSPLAHSALSSSLPPYSRWTSTGEGDCKHYW